MAIFGPSLCLALAFGDFDERECFFGGVLLACLALLLLLGALAMVGDSQKYGTTFTISESVAFCNNTLSLGKGF